MHVLLDRDQRVVVLFFAGERVQFVGIGKLRADLDEIMDDSFERFFFTPEFLGMLGVVPDVGVFELGVDLL